MESEIGPCARSVDFDRSDDGAERDDSVGCDSDPAWLTKLNPHKGDKLVVSVAVEWRGRFGNRVSVAQDSDDANLGPTLLLNLEDIVKGELVSRHNDISADKPGTIRQLPRHMYEVEAIAIKRRDGSWMVVRSDGGMITMPRWQLQHEVTNGKAPVIDHVRNICGP